jgi:putative ABC transport system permease protein
VSAANVAIRLARREVVRRPWRSLMVMLLVIGPVVILTGLAVMVRTQERPLDDVFTHAWGDADIVTSAMDVIGDPGSVPPIPTGGSTALDLPAGSERLDFREATIRIKTADAQREWARVTDLAVDHAMVGSTVDEVTGRMPAGDDEVLISSVLADRLGLSVGDTLALSRPVESELTIVGTATWRDELSRNVVLVDREADGTLLSQVTDVAAGMPAAIERTLFALPEGAEPSPQLLEQLTLTGHDNRFVEPWSNGDQAQLAIVWSWVGGAVAFVIVGVVIAAAFAVTARRQLRLIGQLMGNGASEHTLRATLFLQGSVIGFVGGVVGIGLALGALVALQPLVEQLVDRRIDGYDVRLGDLVPILVLSTLAATIAALIPARTAIRTSVLEALSGRRPVGPYPARLVIRGALAAAAGLVLLAVATAGSVNSGAAGGSTWLFVLTGIAGAVAVILGTCAMSPGIISRLEPLAGRLRGTARLAARSVARQRSRTGAIVAAVAVVAAGAVAGSTVWMTSVAEEASADGWQMPDDLVVMEHTRQTETGATWTFERLRVSDELLAEILEVLPGAVVHHTRVATAPDVESGQTADWSTIGGGFLVVDDTTADALDLGPEARAALEARGIVTVDWESEETGERATTGERAMTIVDDEGQTFATDVMMAVLPAELLPRFGPIIDERTATDLGLLIGPGQAFVTTPGSLTEDQRDALGDLQEDLWSMDATVTDGGQTSSYIWMDFHRPAWEPSRTLVTAGIVAVATIFSLAVVALGLALSAAETKDERDVLAAVGARPRTLRRLAGAKAAVLSATGTTIGVPLGFIPTLVVVQASQIGVWDPTPVVFPWVQVGLLVVAVPVVATAATIVASDSGPTRHRG